MEMMKKRYSIFLLIITIFTFSCSKESQEQAESPDPGETVPATQLTLNQPEGATEIRETDSGPSNNRSGSQQPAIETITMSSQEKLSSRIILPPVYPEDMIIGEVGGEPRDRDEWIILETLNLFFNDMSSGELNTEGVESGSRNYLEKILRPVFDNEIFPDSFRLGKPFLAEEDNARVNVRLFGIQGRSSGEVFLVKEEGNWMISDIQIDFSKLSEVYKKEYETFEPRLYRWLELY